MKITEGEKRRTFLISTLGTASLLPFLSGAVWAADEKGDDDEVTPNEDLMREHGLLRRVILIYEENLRLIPKKEHRPLVIKKSANTIRSFIENYHEKLEEEFLFPALIKAKREVELVETLKRQHGAGRTLTESIIALAEKGASSVTKLEDAMRSFIHMYNAHAAREDTVLFPAFKEVVGLKRYKELGDQFEEREHKMFGKEGFEGVLAQVAELEKEIGISDLNGYTPKV